MKLQFSLATRLGLLLLALVFAISTLWYLGFASSGWTDFLDESTAQVPKRVILISIDTLRADHLSCYGYSRPTSPALDDLADHNSVQFDRAYSAAPRTLPSMMTIVTSLYPTQHQIENRGDRLNKIIPTLASVFQKNGWHTAAFITHIFVSHLFGFDNGFDEFRELSINWNFEEGFQVRAERLNAEVFPWLEKNRHEQFFLHLHYFDPHWDYDPPPPFNKKFVDPNYNGEASGSFKYLRRFLRKRNPLPAADLQYVTALYDGEIAYTDHNLKALFEKLKSLRMWDDTLLVVTADHGEEFKEHGSLHHHTLYNEDLHVPFIIKFPGTRPHGWRKVVTERVSTIDLAPTLLEICRLKAPSSFQGHSLIPIMKKNGVDRTIYARVWNPSTFDIAVIRDDYKFLFKHGMKGDVEEMYNLNDDPAEQRSILQQQTKAALVLKKMVFEWVREGKNSPFANQAKEKTQLSKEQEELLKSLGYID